VSVMRLRIGDYLLYAGIIATLIGGLAILWLKLKAPKLFVWSAQ
jgi:hypothetical protein